MKPSKPVFREANKRYLDIAVLYLEKLEKLDKEERDLFYQILYKATRPITIQLNEDVLQEDL